MTIELYPVPKGCTQINVVLENKSFRLTIKHGPDWDHLEVVREMFKTWDAKRSANELNKMHEFLLAHEFHVVENTKFLDRDVLYERRVV